jgi:hypothetical protein
MNYTHIFLECGQFKPRGKLCCPNLSKSKTWQSHSSRMCTLIWINGISFCKYQCGYGLKDHLGNRNHMKSIKHGHLAHFSIKRITTLTSHDLIMEIMQNLFIHDLYVSHINIMHWKHISHIDLQEDVKFVWHSFIHRFVLQPSTSFIHVLNVFSMYDIHI